MDIKSMTFGICNIKCPTKGPIECVIVSNKYKHELSISGYIRNIWKNHAFDDMTYPPVYLIKIMESYYDLEEIHLFWKYLHWKISVEDILNNTVFGKQPNDDMSYK